MRIFHYYTPIFLQKVGYVVFFTLYRTFVRLEVRGRENLKDVKGPVIFASNHTDELDATAVGLALPFISKFYPIYYVANPQEKYQTFGWRSFFYGGVFFNLLGAYSIYSGHHDYGISLEDHITLLKKGRSVIIFPEGKRSDDGTLNPPRGGLGYMVHVTGATVVPVAINTFYNITAREFFLSKRKLVLTVLPPISPQEIISVPSPQVEDFRRGSQVVLDRIKEVLAV